MNLLCAVALLSQLAVPSEFIHYDEEYNSRIWVKIEKPNGHQIYVPVIDGFLPRLEEKYVGDRLHRHFYYDCQVRYIPGTIPVYMVGKCTKPAPLPKPDLSEEVLRLRKALQDTKALQEEVYHLRSELKLLRQSQESEEKPTLEAPQPIPTSDRIRPSVIDEFKYPFDRTNN